MKAQTHSLHSVIFSDLVCPRSIKYFIIVSEDNLCCLRVVGTKQVDLVLSKEWGDSIESFERFVQELKDSPSYYGQPVEILLNNNHAFTYIKRTDKLSPAQIMDEIKTIQSEGIAFFYQNEQTKSGRYLIAQGIEKEYLGSIETICESEGLLVTGITTLASFLFPKLSIPEPGQTSIMLFDFTAFRSCLLFNKSGQVLYERCHTNEDLGSTIESIRSLYLGGEDQSIPIIYSLQSNKNEFGLSNILGNRFKDYNRSKSVSHKLSTSRLAKTVAIAMSSLKLLMFIIGTVSILSLLTTGIMSLSVTGDDELISQYQKLYTNKQGLLRCSDSLQTIQRGLKTNKSTNFDPGAILSTFCQTRYKGLHLNGISIRPMEGDSVLVELIGSARREHTIFQYNQALNELTKPYHLNINSIVPEITGSRNNVDTLINFKLSMVIKDD